MLSKKLKFLNFNNVKKSNNLKLKIKKFKIKRWTKEFPVLKSFSSDYEYSYTRNFLKKLKKNKNFRVIGMGGSVLGAEAIYQFLKKKIRKNFLFTNNLEANLSKNKTDLNIIISKSGSTLETISNFHILLNRKIKSNNVFITEKNNNYLRRLAMKLKADILEHRNFIGGRYSVLSEVGMLPAELMGLDANKFKKFNLLIKNNNFVKNLILNVEAIYKYTKQGKNNSIILNYDSKSENLFKWYQQLVAESLGKKSIGITPIISSMPKDNHSLLQLYLDGPRNSFFTFFNVKEKKSDRIRSSLLDDSMSYLKYKKLAQIVEAQMNATKIVFNKKKIPFRSFEALERSEEVLGELFNFFVLETILLGKYLKVNPFDQPSVELIKIETKKLLY